MKLMTRVTVVLVILSCVFFAYPAVAEEMVAELIGSGQYSNVQQAIDAASNGDTVVLLKDAAENIAVSGKKLTFDLGGYTLTSPGAAGSTFFSVTDNADVTVKNGTLAGAVDTDGNPVQVAHAVYVKGSKFTLDEATISGHSVAVSGGGIYAEASTVTLQNGAMVTGNKANGIEYTRRKVTAGIVVGIVGNGGGGIFACDGSVITVDASTISKNTATKAGGGVFLDASMLTAKNGTRIIENHAAAKNSYNGGGGIFSVNKAVITLTDSHVDNNTAAQYGAAIAIYNDASFGNAEAPLTINNSTVNGNATAYGAIYLSTGASSTEKISITGTTFDENESTRYCALYLQGGANKDNKDNLYVTIKDSRFSGNKGNSNGSGSIVYISNSNHLNISNTVIDSNTGGQAPLNLVNCGNFVLDKLTVSKNTASNAGGIYMDQCTGSMSGSSIINNASTNTVNNKSAGGIAQNNNTSVNYTGCRISGNTSAVGTGGILVGVSYAGGDYYASATMTGTIVTNNTGKYMGGITYIGDTVSNGSSLTFKADGDRNGAVYGNTCTGSASGHDLSLTPVGAVSVMAASTMKDGSTVLKNYAFISGSTVYPKETVLTTAFCADNNNTGYTVQPYVERFVAQNVSGEDCANNEEKYTLLEFAIAALEAEETADADHALKLIAGESDDFGTEIKERVTVSKNLEIQLNERTLKASTGTAITVANGAKLIISGKGTVDTYQTGEVALTVNGECTVTGEATIPSVRLGADKSVAVTDAAHIDKVYLDADVLKNLNLSAADMSVTLFTPYNDDDTLSELASSIKVDGVNALVTVGQDADRNVVASCKKVQGVFVDGVNGKDSNDGLSPDKAKKTIAEALKVLEANPDLGGIYVVNTVTLSNSEEWDGDLGGAWLKRFPTLTGAMISIPSGYTLSLSNVVVDGNSKLVNATEAMISVARGGTLNIYDGAVLCNNSRDNANSNFEYGGAVISYGTVNMTGGTVSGNNADQGGGICMYGSGAKLTLSDGSIENNTTNINMTSSYGPSGGGVLLVYGADMDMSGGTVSGNVARYGAGIAVGAAYDNPDSVFTMTGGTIKNNQAIQHGGGLFVQTNCKATVSGGSVTDNSAALNGAGVFAGGGIYVNGNRVGGNYNYGELHLTDAIITENTAGTDLNGPGGGGIGGCGTSITLIYNNNGAAIYNNTGMDLALKFSAGEMVGGIAPEGDIAEFMLGGGSYNWTDENGIQYTSTMLDNFRSYDALKANPTADAIAAAESLGKVIITGNSTGGNGGGIGSNGIVFIGREENVIDLTVTKVWNEPDNEEQLTEKDGKYYLYPIEGAEIVHPETFRVWLLRDGERVSVVEFKAESGTDESGKSYLAWPKSLTFNDLPAGDYTYTVEEEMPADALYTGVVSGNAADGFVVTNYYNPTCTIQFEGQKILEGRELTAEDQFTFAVMEGDKVIATAVSDSTGKIVFPEITLNLLDVGTHTYTVSETSQNAKGITVDTRTYDVVVTVTNNGDGTLSATVSKNSLALNFTNTYSPAPVFVSFPVKKVLSVPAGLTPGDITGKFTFTLAAVTDNTPLPAVVEYTNPDKDGGVVTFGTIEYTAPGTYEYIVTETGSAAGVTNDATAAKTVTVTVVDNGDGTLTATASSTANAPLTFTNTYGVEPTKASFPVEKVLSVPTGLTADDITGKFTFTLTAEDGVPMPDVVEYTNPDKDGGVVTFGEIEYTEPGTYEYIVTETGTADGVTNDTEASKTVTVTVVDNGDGTLTATADSTDAAPLTFTNTYGVEPTTVSFPVEKVLSVPTGLTADDITGKFIFTLTAEDGVPMPDVVEYTNPDKDGGVVTFGEIEYSKPGTYTYTVTETGTADGVTNDTEASKTVTVTVVDNGDGTLTATASSTADKPLTFTNTYGVEPTTASFPVEKVLSVPTGLTADDITGKFTFTLTAEDGVPMPDVVEYTNPDKDGGVVIFGEIEYSKPGTYTYTVTETGTADGVTNDTEASKTVTVTVVDNGDGTLTATAGSTADKPLIFTNAYSVKSTTTSFQISKTLVGRALNAGEFSFELKDATGKVLQTKTNAADGSVSFDEITYTKPGTFAYSISEVSGTLTGITYDDGTINVTVEVVDNGDGTLTATASYGEKKGFENHYHSSNQLVLTGTKKITGREYKSDDEFLFELVENGTVIQRCVVKPVGGSEEIFSFDSIPYTNGEAGTYRYTVREAVGSIKGMTYDVTQYTVDVTVTDDGKGGLQLDAVYSVDGKKVDAIVFTNIYEATGELELTAEKTVNDATPAADQVFSFTLSDEDGEIETVQNKLGEITFTRLTYTLDDLGKHTYTIRETTAGEGNLTTDETVYTVNVTVADNGDGTLKIVKEITADGKPADEITFNNIIEAPLTISKTVMGCETAKTFGMTVTLYNADGTEANGTFTYTGDVEGELSSGDVIQLGHDQQITIKGLIPGMKYQVQEEKTPAFSAMVNNTFSSEAAGTLTAEGAKVSFVNTLVTTDFSVTKEWRGGDEGAILLTLYANGEKMEPQPECIRSGNHYKYRGLPQFDEDGDLIVYTAKEKYVDGYMTMYVNVKPNKDVTNVLHNGGTVINKKIVEASFTVQKVWSGLAEDEEAPEITLILYCNGKATDYPTPEPDKNGWYKYYDLPEYIGDEPAVYTVKEEVGTGFSTTYTLANGEAAEYADNGGTITNTIIPKTGDDAPVTLWLTAMLASAAALLLMTARRKKA